MTVSPGDTMPDFDLPTDGGGRISSAQLKGRPYVLYLYPKDDTPGCTLEAQTFASRYGEFEAIGFEVVGLSRDSVSSHDRFKRKCGLSFPLASDEDGRLVEALGSWVEKSNYGKTYMGIDRSTFLINAEGMIVRTWRGVKVPGHVEDVLAAATEVGH